MSVENKVPVIRFEGFEDEWKTFKLGELGKVATNKRIFMHQTSSTGDVPFYKIGTFGKNPKLFIAQKIFETYKERFPYPLKGDLLFSVIGSIGRVVEYKGENEYFQDSNIVWLQHNGAIVNAFLKQFYSIVEWSGLEGSTIKHLYNRNILDTKIKLPSQKEQTKIGNYFQQLDILITQHQKKHDKLLTIKKALLEKMFPKQGQAEPEIRFKGFSGEWEEKKVINIAPLQRGFDLPKNKMKKGHYPVVMSNGINGFHYEYKVQGPGVVTGRSGTIGNIHYIVSNYWPHNTALWVTNFNGNEPLYIYYMYLKLDLNRFSTGSGVPTLNRNDVHDKVVRIPKVKEQTQIGMLFNKLDTLITRHQAQLKKLNNIKQACLAKMFV